MPSPRPAVAFVSGGNRGIGAELCRRLAREGWGVVVAARDRAASLALAERIEGKGGRAWPVALDVAEPASVARGVEEALALTEGSGPIEALVANAGIAESAPLLPPKGGGDERYRRLLEVNFHGARRLVEALAPGMVARGRGRIVCIASSAGLRGYRYISAYCASKFALVGYVLAAAEELRGSGVTVNAVCPHYVETEMLERSVANLVEKTGRSADQARAFFAAENPGGRLVRPEEVAEAAAALVAGEETGLLVELDGSGEPKVHQPAGEERS